MSRYIRLVFASGYARARHQETLSKWWLDRYLTIERERQEFFR